MHLPMSKLALFSLLAFVAPRTIAQDTSQPKESEGQGRLPYEVIVTPNVTLSGLQKLLVQIEDDFYEKFNELNIDDDYDVQCYEFRQTGSHLKSRVCEPNFFIDARGDNASEFLFDLSGYTPFTPMLFTRKDIRHNTRADFEILQKKMVDFYRADVEFQSIGEAMAKVKSRLENHGKD